MDPNYILQDKKRFAKRTNFLFFFFFYRYQCIGFKKRFFVVYVMLIKNRNQFYMCIHMIAITIKYCFSFFFIRVSDFLIRKTLPDFHLFHFILFFIPIVDYAKRNVSHKIKFGLVLIILKIANPTPKKSIFTYSHRCL